MDTKNPQSLSEKFDIVKFWQKCLDERLSVFLRRQAE
jgi:hypothetical protein